MPERPDLPVPPDSEGEPIVLPDQADDYDEAEDDGDDSILTGNDPAAPDGEAE